MLEAPFSTTISFVFLTLAFVAIRWLNKTNIPKIKNLPEVPGIPLFGNLLQLGSNHARVAGSWVHEHGPVFQVRLGNRRMIFANTFDSVRELWITNQSALRSRPTQYTFHSIVSSSQCFTIGTSPWDESLKRRRKAAATALNKTAVESYMPILDLESCVAIRDLYQDSIAGGEDGQHVDLDPRRYFNRFALNTTLTLNYGIRIDGGIDEELVQEVVHVERIVSNFRSTSNNWQDYIPLLRLPFISRQNTDSVAYSQRRAKYIATFLAILKERINKGTDKPCIAGNIIKDPDTKLNDTELHSICLSMVAAGIDTIPANMIMGLGFLASPQGQEIQKKAYREIIAVYPTPGEAWEKCLREEKIPYMTAVVKEILRFWSVLPLSLPRTSVRDIPFNDAVIPAGTTFILNVWAANYDDTHFKDPNMFIPERYLSDMKESLSHCAYGAGSRMCIGSHLANRQLYVMFVRMVTAFEIVPAERKSDWPVLDALDCNSIPTALTTEPKPFKIGLKARDRKLMEQWIKESQKRTNDL
ncbi:MAG: hypothetical protein Q9167_007166 [Letrouitia subvulpina]